MAGSSSPERDASVCTSPVNDCTRSKRSASASSNALSGGAATGRKRGLRPPYHKRGRCSNRSGRSFSSSTTSPAAMLRAIQACASAKPGRTRSRPAARPRRTIWRAARPGAAPPRPAHRHAPRRAGRCGDARHHARRRARPCRGHEDAPPARPAQHIEHVERRGEPHRVRVVGVVDQGRAVRLALHLEPMRDLRRTRRLATTSSGARPSVQAAAKASARLRPCCNPKSGARSS